MPSRSDLGPALGRRGAGGSLFEGPLELVDIEPEVGVGVEPDRITGGDQAVLVAHGGADLPERLAEPTAAPRLGHVGPEGADEEITGVAAVPVEDQIGHDGTGCARRNRRERLAVPPELEPSEEADLKSPHG